MFFLIFLVLLRLLHHFNSNMSSDQNSELEPEKFKLYLYDPSLPAAIIFAVLFLAVTVRHIQILFRERTWAFIPFVVGCVCKSPRVSGCRLP